MIIPNIYAGGSPFSEGLATVNYVDRSSVYIDKAGREVISFKYDSVRCFAFRKDGFIGVTLKGKKGFVHLYGNEYFDF